MRRAIVVCQVVRHTRSQRIRRTWLVFDDKEAGNDEHYVFLLTPAIGHVIGRVDHKSKLDTPKLVRAHCGCAQIPGRADSDVRDQSMRSAAKCLSSIPWASVSVVVLLNLAGYVRYPN